MTKLIFTIDEARIQEQFARSQKRYDALEAEALALKATSCEEFMGKLDMLREFFEVRGTRPQDLRPFRVLQSIREDIQREIS
jgi:hypothetical protein